MKMAHNRTHRTDHYEIGAEDYDVGAGPSISEDAFPQDVSLGARLEIGAGQRFEIGAPESDPAKAVKKVIKTARDTRQPPPVMKAVPVDAPPTPADVENEEVLSWFSDIVEGVGCMIGAANPFPLTTKLLTRFGAGMEKPRYVRVDTEDSYKAFRADSSPEMSEYRDKLREVSDRLDAHVRDPRAHESDASSEDLADAIEEAEAVGAAAQEAEKSKQVDLWLKDGVKDHVRAWQEGDYVGVSMVLPGGDLIATSMSPSEDAIGEMEEYAAAANVSAAAVVGVIPAMGCVLGAGTLLKEQAAATKSIMEMSQSKGGKPFVCRIEPKAAPSLCALVALACMCAKGDKQACAEWDLMASAASKGGAKVVSDAMKEAVNLCRQLEKMERVA